MFGCIFLQQKYTEQVQLNDQLTGEISELRQEVLQIQEIPRRLGESVASCKDFYEDVLSTMQVKPVYYLLSLSNFIFRHSSDIYFLMHFK